ncbi:GNAT family N-acetyltransferase [Streptomyces sp. NPDC060334]|uniref:GNAT family N-acetyltransferase n=1 Tax=unclassified Streptomyces TaxID=2593676 RepID=UPI00224D6250|nr:MULTISPECIES: GNAT family N-acetyltransferase [unclassified Streptomyces]MCX5073454.1 GNAT family N-acetyltransferase [Streptomyces sp. NBC_00424]MCX5154998.1 GNAT family N-acetyltransferase [Streptomyces sp. NBC_00291]WUD43292.1 GNAT family N-acetyltransferase [Streptomyces sp. NBC_00513]
MDIVIRAASVAEYEELGEITARAYLDDGLLDFNEDDFYLNVLRDVAGRAASGEVLVADHDGTVLGGVTFASNTSPLADIAGPGEAEFRMLAVAREARGRGAGEALVRACMARAGALEGVTHLVLSTQRSMTGAHRIYERLGFTRTPERDWAPIPGLTLLTYRLEL